MIQLAAAQSPHKSIEKNLRGHIPVRLEQVLTMKAAVVVHLAQVRMKSPKIRRRIITIISLLNQITRD